MSSLTRPDDQKLGIKILDTWAHAIGDVLPERPDITSFWLLTAFRLKRAQCRHFPERWQMPSAQLAARLALDTVTDALEDPDNTVLTGIFMPPEIMHCLGLHPLIAEAAANFVAAAHAEAPFVEIAEQSGIPETYCSFHKVLLGEAYGDILEPPKLIVCCSVACDANNLTFRLLAEKFGCPMVYIDVPDTYTEENCAYVADQLRDFASLAEKVYGRTLSMDDLKERVARSQETLENLRRSLPLRQGRFIRNNMGLEMQHALALHTLLGEKDTLEMTERMLEDYPKATPFDGVDLVWSATAPFYSVPLQKLLDVNDDQQVIASDMCFDQVSFDGWHHGPDEPFEAMAERLLRNAYNGGAERRLACMETIARETAADGAVVFCHWGCKETMGAAQIMRRGLEEAQVPCLVLDGDGCNRGNFPGGQAATRLGAFLEMLHGRRDHTTPVSNRPMAV